MHRTRTEKLEGLGCNCLVAGIPDDKLLHKTSQISKIAYNTSKLRLDATIQVSDEKYPLQKMPDDDKDGDDRILLQNIPDRDKVPSDDEEAEDRFRYRRTQTMTKYGLKKSW